MKKKVEGFGRRISDDNNWGAEDKFKMRGMPKRDTEHCTVRARERVGWDGNAIGRTN